MRCVEAEAIFSKLPEKEWRERHFICFGFVSRELFSVLSAAFLYWPGFRSSFCFFGCSIFCRLYGFGWGGKLGKLQGQRQQWLCKRALLLFVHFFASVYKSSQNNNAK